MKVAVLSESSADEAATRVFVDALLGRPTQAPAMPSLRTRGWPRVCDDVPRTLKHLYYQTDAEAFVVVVDSDRSPVHQPGLGTLPCSDECRLCTLARIVERTLARLTTRQQRPPIKVAIGVAVPQIEAWYHVGRDPNVSEASWLNGVREGRIPYDSRRLKRKVYQTERPSIDLETARALEESRRIVETNLLDQLVSLFPIGFGMFAEAVRNW